MKSVEVIAIGNEVLSGWTINSNAAEISRALTDAGFQVLAHRVVPDELAQITEALEDATARADIVVTSGGLGPTLDDNTRTALAQHFNSDIVRREEVAKDLQQRFGDKTVSLDDQVLQPAAAELMLNPIGTAPGLLFGTKRGVLAVLPGVPGEMRAMLNERLVPALQERFPSVEREYRQRLHFCLLREADVDAQLRTVATAYPDLSYGIYPHQGTVAVHLSCHAESQKEADARIRPAADKLKAAFGPRYYGDSDPDIAEAIRQYFTEHKLTLSAAESCTGGAVAARLTKYAGASEYFLGSIVSYANTLKRDLLGVEAELLEAHGAVSEACVRSMAKGALARTHSDYAIAVSGIAGPGGGSADKPVGTVWYAVARPDGEIMSQLFQFPGNRKSIIYRSVNLILGFLWLEIQK